MELRTALFSAEGCGVQPVSSCKDVRPADFIQACAAHLKASGKFKVPQWADYVKTGACKDLAPFDNDWLFVRGASLLRRLFIRPDAGVKGLARAFGGKRNRGARPGHHSNGARGCIRYCLRQFESMGLVAQDDSRDSRGGRRLTSKGVSLVTQVAKSVHQQKTAQ